ncbi:hypothetical protein HNR23_000711 [Nocardiopsis mwathae]|uniref:Lipoprotein n=1 Tax=Nocardiopsis mwathae TaxID=1472723 RepID=A0A7W9YG40_9ACTN|nr:hypothetical protein [Nocardiopsis mwathae]MBB6170651.1 hypothetical protein [Nocardiopsis mwathae]
MPIVSHYSKSAGAATASLLLALSLSACGTENGTQDTDNGQEAAENSSQESGFVEAERAGVSFEVPSEWDAQSEDQADEGWEPGFILYEGDEPVGWVGIYTSLTEENDPNLTGELITVGTLRDLRLTRGYEVKSKEEVDISGAKSAFAVNYTLPNDDENREIVYATDIGIVTSELRALNVRAQMIVDSNEARPSELDHIVNSVKVEEE